MNVRQRVEEIFSFAPFMRELGAELISIGDGEVSTSMSISTRHLQQDGYVHAAVQAALADHTAGAAAATLIESSQAVLTIEYKINLLRPALGQSLRCQARVLKPGKTLSVAESEVYTLGAKSDEKLTAKASVTLAVVERSKIQAPLIEHIGTEGGYDRWSSIYDGEDNALVTLEEPVVDELLGDIAGKTVADLGCGTGRHALRLAGRGARVLAFDFSQGMLEIASEKAEQLNLALPPRFARHDLEKPLPLAAGSMDRVLSALVLDHVADLRGFFAELLRLCAPDGSVVTSVMHPAMLLRGVMARFRDPQTGREVRPQSHAHQIADYLQAALAAGLRLDHLSEHSVTAAQAERSVRARKYLGWNVLLAMRFVHASRCP